MLLLLSRLCSSGNRRAWTKIDQHFLWEYEMMLSPVRAAMRENCLPGRKAVCREARRSKTTSLMYAGREHCSE